VFTIPNWFEPADKQLASLRTQLTPLSKFLLEKLVVALLAKNFLAFIQLKE
jgi:hypothetical protein